MCHTLHQEVRSVANFNVNFFVYVDRKNSVFFSKGRFNVWMCSNSNFSNDSDRDVPELVENVE